MCTRYDIVEADEQCFRNLFPRSGNIFSSLDFNLLNENKLKERPVFMIIREEGKPRLGLIAGNRDGRICAPFSAPYSFFVWKKKPSLQTFAKAAETLVSYLKDSGRRLRLIMPPLCHDPEMIQAVWATLLTNGASTEYVDYNFHIELSRDMDLMKEMTVAGRNQLRMALKEGVKTMILDDFSDATFREAYSIIEENHRMKGFPMTMSAEQYLETMKLVKGYLAFAFAGEKKVAAAILFEVNPAEIVQAISWGDLREYSNLRPMNALLSDVAEIFASRGFRLLDMGPSSSSGVPALGQAHFKQACGAKLSLKPTLIL